MVIGMVVRIANDRVMNICILMVFGVWITRILVVAIAVARAGSSIETKRLEHNVHIVVYNNLSAVPCSPMYSHGYDCNSHHGTRSSDRDAQLSLVLIRM